MLRAVVTARREPVTTTVLRALHAASADDPELLAALESLPTGAGFDAALLEVIRSTAARRPVLMIIDEFGKNLEYFSESHSGGDLFFLQELAELASGHRASPVYLLTFQHATFTEYSTGITSLQGREWRKIQGRFHDVTYSDDASDVAALVGATLTQNLDTGGQAALQRYAKAATTRWRELGLDALLPGNPDLFAMTYPVHPLALTCLPELCARLGQHERTLAGFLTADEPHTVARFLHDSPSGIPDPKTLATVKLDTVYDYFADTVASSAAAAGARWIEITARVESARHLDDIDELDLRLMKAAGLLNLVSAGGVLRASLPTLTFALSDPQQVTGATRTLIARKVQGLQDRGFLTYRRHDDEYRLWAGTDIDIAARVQVLREQLGGAAVAELLTRSYLPTAVVAGRHSQVTGMLRYFQPMVADASSGATFSGDRLTGRPDGFIVMDLSDGEVSEPPAQAVPVLVGSTPDTAMIRRAATETLALGELLDAADLDPVARAEVKERLSSARSVLTNVVTRAFDPTRKDVTWRLRVADLGLDQTMGIQPSMSALVSVACDIAYRDSPRIRSEMLGRHQLTSQGAKARRELLTALLEHPGAPCAGLTGHGPDVAMYRGVVEPLGLHGPVGADATYGWTKPDLNDSSRPSYQAMTDHIRSQADGVSAADLEALVAKPPYGVKAGVFPILFAALLSLDLDIAIFEDGTFQTALQPELLERAIKGPERIILKHSAVGSGQPAEVIGKLGQVLGLTQGRRRAIRTPSLVFVVATLLQNVSAMSEFARHTRRLSMNAIAARTALLTARDPAQLVFHDLPVALGYDAITAGSAVDVKIAGRLVDDITSTMDELRTVDAALAQTITEHLGSALSPPAIGVPAIRRTLARQARLIAVAPTDLTVRAFLQHALQDALDDADWLAQAAMIIESKPPNQWRDENVDSFAAGARHLLHAIGRLYALHLDAPGENSSARRLTLTTADGQEEHLVLEATANPDAEIVVDQALHSARAVLGADAERQLLSVLASRALRNTTAGALHE